MQSIRLHDPSSGNSASILVDLGLNCYEWNVHFTDGPRNLIWSEEGFETGERRPSGSGIPLLFPFPGRIGNSQFVYAGRRYELEHDPSRLHALHGFVFNRPWSIIDQTQHSVEAEFHAASVDQTILEQWPSDFKVRANYEIAGNELRFNATFSNVGDTDLPWGFGTHAYFRLPMAEESAVEDTILTVPVNGEWKLEDMLPTGQRLPLSQEIELVSGMRITDHHFDTPYSLSEQAGTARTIVADPASGRRIVQEFDAATYPCVVIYTPGDRQSVCVEPYSCVPDLFRLSESGIESGIRVLGPGEEFHTKLILRAEE